MASKKHIIETSLTLQYRSTWGIERLVLDSISNHLPEDSNGTKAYVQIKQNGTLVELKDADKNIPIEEIVFGDDGTGYDYALLELLYSTKGDDVLSVGQFGEGIKLAPLVAARLDLEFELESWNWHAKPFIKKDTLPVFNKKTGKDENTPADTLCFTITTNGKTIDGSRTIIKNPPKELVDEVFLLPTKVLALNDTYEELYNEKNRFKDSSIIKQISSLDFLYDITFDTFDTFDYIKNPSSKKPKEKYYSSIIRLQKNNDTTESEKDRGTIFVKGVKIKNQHSLFSYNLGIEDIHNDRNDMANSVLLTEVRRLLQECTNSEVIETVLKTAETYPLSSFLELRAFENFSNSANMDNEGRMYEPILKMNPRKKDSNNIYDEIKKIKNALHPWVLGFKKVYGDKAILASYRSFTNTDAELKGYTPVKLHRGIEDFLSDKGILRADDLSNSNETTYRWISRDALTNEEISFLDKVKDACKKIVGDTMPQEVSIYSGLFQADGTEITSSRGVTEIINNEKKIGLKRELLTKEATEENIQDATDVLLHECGHYLTNAGDYDEEFRNFFKRKLTDHVLRELEESPE